MKKLEELQNTEKIYVYCCYFVRHYIMIYDLFNYVATYYINENLYNNISFSLPYK